MKTLKVQHKLDSNIFLFLDESRVKLWNTCFEHNGDYVEKNVYCLWHLFTTNKTKL